MNTAPSIDDFDDFDGDDSTCWKCGGEGFYADCFEEFACIDPEGSCDLCTRRCDVCRGKGDLK
ncbi:hypothetical protein [Amorphus sp. MBR-141]